MKNIDKFGYAVVPILARLHDEFPRACEFSESDIKMGYLKNHTIKGSMEVVKWQREFFKLLSEKMSNFI